ncbi:family 10 glycosylhydrolase [Pontibacter sp. H249]|uniref:family 10 glycosylhydrolase n=1 Tax=Pontibacter sp. H249 TaxID=3133420 RepID=UPI0030BFF69F
MALASLLPKPSGTTTGSIIFLCIVLYFVQAYAAIAQALPNREFRGVWVATVSNLDWPQQGATAENQKAALRTLFDKIKDANLNAVFFQIRTESDALYNSSKEPWSRFLTGKQGVNPGYDPLAFAIEEAHKRGLELHAWINPFRVNASTSASITYADNHVSKSKPEWLLSFSTGKKILNPGLPEVRTYIASIVKEVADNYAVDGIHFDDYFYPYPETNFTGITTEDAQTYNQYGAGFTDVKAWRRHNVNETIRLVHEVLQSSRPQARFGVSPFGIYKNGTPAGITGMDAYNAIYADPINWLENGHIDYLTPQLYWPIGGAQDYRKLLEWWSDKTYASSRHLYAGHAIYKTTYTEQETLNQIEISRLNRHKNALGDVLYRAVNLKDNTLNIYTNLKNNTYQYPAAPPAMPWKNGAQPLAPENLAVTVSEATGEYVINWQRNAASTNPFKRYLVYTSATMPASITDIPEGAVRALVTTETLTIPAAQVPQHASYWVVTELSNSNVESALSNVVTTGNLTASTKPVKESNEVKVYPNPAGRTLYVELTLKKSSLVRIDFVSMDGRIKLRPVQKRYEAGSHIISINRERLNPGVYALIVTADRQRTVKKVILK